MKIIAVGILAALTLPAYAHAALVITKIVSNPPGANAGRQWVEVTNTGTDPIDLGAKNIRFFTTSGNHLIKAYGSGETVLPAGTVGVIAQDPMSFLFDMPSYTGALFKSSFTLSSAGIVGVVQTDGTVLVRKSYVAPPTSKASAKPSSTSKSTTKRATTRTTSGTSKSQLKSSKTTSYGKGTVAPAASADAEAAGAVFALPVALAPLAPYLRSPWFSLYLALVAFSGFSLIVIQRHYV